MNNLILTALQNKYPLHSFNVHVCRMTKPIRPKRDKLTIKIVYHCILQVHSIFGKMSSCPFTAPTSFICCKVRLEFVCLHNMYNTKVVTKIDIITAMKRKTSVVKLLKKEFLLVNSKFKVICLSFISKISFFF